MTADVNIQFDTQRGEQIARYYENLANRDARIAQADADVKSGKLRDMGNGRYQMTEGWDRGEVFNMNAAGLMLPQAGLDVDVNGKALGYFAQPEWHGLGTVIPGGTTDIAKILEVSGLDWDVEKVAVRYFGDSPADLRELPDAYVTRRSDTRDGLGVVGSRYEPVQNVDAFGFLADLLGKREILPVSAFPMRGGKIVVVALRLPEDVIIDAQGVGDVIRPYLMARNSHDGRTPVQAVVTPWRPRCSNTERIAMANAITRWSTPHLRNALRNIDQARQTLKLTVNYYAEFGRQETKLARTELTVQQVDAIIAEMDAALWPDKAKDQTEGKGKPSKRSETTRRERTEGIRDIFGVERERVGQTAYAVERAYTDYLDHVAPRRIQGMAQGAAMATAIVEGAEDARKATVHQRLMLTVR